MVTKIRSSAVAAKLWVAVRFVVFGIGGFLLMIATWVSFLTDRFSYSVWPLICIPLAVIGAFSMLYGVGEWGKWGYLGAFASLPLSMLLWFLPFYPQDKIRGMLSPVLLSAGAYVLAKRHYARL